MTRSEDHWLTQRLKRRYVDGKITLEEFENAVDDCLAGEPVSAEVAGLSHPRLEGQGAYR